MFHVPQLPKSIGQLSSRLPAGFPYDSCLVVVVISLLVPPPSQFVYYDGWIVIIMRQVGVSSHSLSLCASDGRRSFSFLVWKNFSRSFEKITFLRDWRPWVDVNRPTRTSIIKGSSHLNAPLMSYPSLKLRSHGSFYNLLDSSSSCI